VNILKEQDPELQVLVPAAPTVADTVKSRIAGWPHRAYVLEGESAKLSAMKAATVALACSGTVTTELALAGVAMVVGYRLGPITAFILRRMIRTPFITLFNIAAQEFIAPELVQEQCTGPNLARELALRLDDAELRHRQVIAQYAALDRMGRGGPDPNDVAAEAVLKLLRERGR
jgi:lipid-A-disaccharide synthase